MKASEARIGMEVAHVRTPTFRAKIIGLSADGELLLNTGGRGQEDGWDPEFWEPLAKPSPEDILEATLQAFSKSTNPGVSV